MKQASKKNRPFHSIKLQFPLYMACMSAILLLLCFVLVNEAKQSVLNDFLQYAQQNSQLLQNAFDQAAQQADSIFIRLQYEESCKELMLLDSSSSISLDLISDLNGIFSTLPGVPTTFEDIALYSDRVFLSNIYLREDLNILNERSGERRGTLALGIYTSSIISSKRQVPSQYLVFFYNYYSRSKKLGNAVASINLSELPAGFPFIQSEGSYQILMDSNGNLCFLGIDTVQKENAPDLSQIQELLLSHPDISSIRSGRFVFQAFPVNSAGCTLISVVDRSAVTARLDSMYVFCVSLSIFLLITYVICNFFFHRNTVAPLGRLSSYIVSLQGKDLSTTTAELPLDLSGCTEVQLIGEEFAKLIDHLIRLSAEMQQNREAMYQIELQRKNAEIESLRSQINPHFLYNTLELIRADAIAGKVDQISLITASMGKMYRYAIKGDPIVTLAEEAEMVKAYINIQKQRYRNQMSVLFHISDEAAARKIPRMILQPLVENAFLHGLEPLEGPWTLYISADIVQDSLRISIRDNGVGIPPSQLEEIRARLHTDGNTDCIGLSNVYTRLSLLYGEKCSFTISSAPGDGTCIQIRIQD